MVDVNHWRLTSGCAFHHAPIQLPLSGSWPYLTAQILIQSELPPSPRSRTILTQSRMPWGSWPRWLGKGLISRKGLITCVWSSTFFKGRIITCRRSADSPSFSYAATADDRIKFCKSSAESRTHDRQVDEENGQTQDGQNHGGDFSHGWVGCSAIVTWRQEINQDSIFGTQAGVDPITLFTP